MSAQVVCPHCGKSIKLRDRSLLGQKGKCPACAKSFLLEEQSAEEEMIPLSLADEEPQVGTGALWVPDHPTSLAAGNYPVAYVPVQTPKGVVLAPVLAGQLPAYPAPRVGTSSTAESPPSSTGSNAFDFDLGSESPALASAVAHSTAHRPARHKRSNAPVWIGVSVAAAIIVGVVVYLDTQKLPIAATPVVVNSNTGTGDVVPDSPSPAGAHSRESLTADPGLVAEFRPTQGEPIPLHMLTGSNNILIHLRPDRIWGTERASQELKASLTEDVVTWLETTIQKMTHRKPEQLEEVLIGISLVSKVEPPQFSTVFRLKTPELRSQLVQEFKGMEISLKDKPLVMQTGEFASHVQSDNRTIAICPAALGGDLSDAVEKPLDCVTDGIRELLKASDRDRSVSVFMDVTDALTYSDQLFEPSALPAITKVLEWFGPDAETVSWSLNLGNVLHSEVRVCPKGRRSGGGKISTAETLRKDFTQRFPATVEQDLVSATRLMRPTRTGFRQIIGRFPAMVEAFRQATIIQPGPTYLTMTTVLPAKAAPNLVLGTVLTWDESTRTNFSPSESAMPMASNDDKLPKTVLGRLKKEFEIAFDRKPLQDAFLFIGDETQVTFVIDGDALKLAGYTKNIAQTFQLGKVSGTKGLHTILTWPMQEKMCLVVDDAKMEALITTTTEAAAKGLKVVPVDSLK